MNKSNPTSITIEEAVARMVNMDYIPEGFSLLDMLDAFRGEAEVEHDNALIDRLPEDQINRLRIRKESCMTRIVLAELLSNDNRNLTTCAN